MELARMSQARSVDSSDASTEVVQRPQRLTIPEGARNACLVQIYPTGKGVGLRLMEHRCAMIGGDFSIEPRQDGGTCIACSVLRTKDP